MVLALIIHCNLDGPNRVKFAKYKGAQGLRLQHILPSPTENGVQSIKNLTFTCDLSISGFRISERMNKHYRVI